MVTPIRPSLAQMLQTPSAAPKPAAQAQASGFNAALAAQKAFFQQVTTPAAPPKITPPTYTAADIARASAQAPAEPDTDAPPKRPGSFLNIVV